MARPSAVWRFSLRLMYAGLRLLDPILRAWWRAFGLGITAQLTVRGRRSGRQRSVLVGLLYVDGRRYVGHPNGAVGWTRNLAAAEEARVAQLPGVWATFRAVPLSDGPERDAIIAATAHQQPFPGNLVYRAAQRHIRAVGVYFRLEALDSAGRGLVIDGVRGGELINERNVAAIDDLLKEASSAALSSWVPMGSPLHGIRHCRV
ncbi:MAG: hypothetical protein E6J50_01315 [Chloroflexi bacterium]|nr:MAG: hypothetical protein E6J50_01315 [Chloroflexota bacterium]